MLRATAILEVRVVTINPFEALVGALDMEAL